MPKVEGSAAALREPRRDWNRIALWLVASTLVYNVVEAVVALWSGSEADSIALFGFGLDSLIESAAASLALWRLSVEARGADRETIERTEFVVLRFVGLTFLLLAGFVIWQASLTLMEQRPVRESMVGIVLAIASSVIMPFVAWAKLHAAKQLGSAALRAEAKETLACSLLSFALLAGLLGNSLGGWWWADPLAALLMVPWLIKEGLEGLRGESCCD